MRLAFGYSTKDKPSSRAVAESFLQALPADFYWFDGSQTPAGQKLPYEYDLVKRVYSNVVGGPDFAFVFAMTTMLNMSEQYTHFAYCEDDFLVSDKGWTRAISLFAQGKADGLDVGIVSPRAYEDRLLIQRDGYGVLNNAGWGGLVFTREAAQLTLRHHRTGWSTENRRVFAQLTGIDIGTYWAFRANEQWLTADWGADAALAQYGLASIALTPSPVEMLGQTPPLEQQGLRLVTRDAPMRRDERVWQRFVDRMTLVRKGRIELNARPVFFQLDDGGHIYFSHQLGALSARWFGTWSMLANMGFGPFGWRAGDSESSLSLELSGPVDILIGGGDKGGTVRVSDMHSGYELEPTLKPSKLGDQLFTSCVVPASVSWRTIRVDRITPGCIVYGVRSREIQPVDPTWRFDASALPSATNPAVPELVTAK